MEQKRGLATNTKTGKYVSVFVIDDIFISDRTDRQGGVLIAAKKHLQAKLQTQLETQCETIWISVSLHRAKTLYTMMRLRSSYGLAMKSRRQACSACCGQQHTHICQYRRGDSSRRRLAWQKLCDGESECGLQHNQCDESTRPCKHTVGQLRCCRTRPGVLINIWAIPRRSMLVHTK